MKKLKLFLVGSILLSGKMSFAQPAAIIQEYIETYREAAIEEMKRTGVPASITLAQGIHETDAGRSVLVKKSNNHFGIKCKSTWTGPSVSHDDDARGECFRKYESPMESYKDHSDFLRNGTRYASLFQLDPTDYPSWAWGLKKAGYATNPKYPHILIKLIEDYNLQDYTLIALGKKTMLSGEVWASEKKVGTSDAINVNNSNTTIPSKQVSYPAGIFRINETNVVYVSKGTPYLTIAQQYNIALKRLFDFNDMQPTENAATDQLVFLQRKRKFGNKELHSVVPGETLYQIAQEEGIRLESLLALNFLKEELQPAIGEVLYLQKPAPAMPRLATSQPKQVVALIESRNEIESISSEVAVNNYLVHTVKPKETMYSIAKKYSVNMDDMLKWNDLQTPELKTGQQLKINKKGANATYQSAR